MCTWVWLFSGFCLVHCPSWGLISSVCHCFSHHGSSLDPRPAVPLGMKTWQESGSHRQVSLSVSWLPCKEAEQFLKTFPSSPSRCSANVDTDLWSLGLADNVLPEQLYWFQYEKFTSAAAKIKLGKKKSSMWTSGGERFCQCRLCCLQRLCTYHSRKSPFATCCNSIAKTSWHRCEDRHAFMSKTGQTQV